MKEINGLNDKSDMQEYDMAEDLEMKKKVSKAKKGVDGASRFPPR